MVKQTVYMERSDRILADIAAVIYQYRISHGLTQSQLARQLGITQSLVSKLESGTYNPNVRLLSEIAERMDLPFDLTLG